MFKAQMHRHGNGRATRSLTMQSTSEKFDLHNEVHMTTTAYAHHGWDTSLKFKRIEDLQELSNVVRAELDRWLVEELESSEVES